MESSFDLTRNAFSLLEVSPRASSAALADAKAERFFDCEHDEKELEEAHSALLVERKRLAHEISWLSDIAPNRAKEIVAKLAKISEADADALIGDGSQLSRLNLAADLLSRFPHKRALATELLEAFEDVDWPSVRQTIDEARVICPLLSGPKYLLFWIMKEIGNAVQEAQAGGDHRQAA